MLGGSVAGGLIAQATNLGVPYMLRSVVLALSFVFALVLMRDTGFTPNRSKHPVGEVRKVLRGAIRHGLGNPPVRWIMLAAPFTGGVSIYAFYAMQPYLLDLHGSERAYAVAGHGGGSGRRCADCRRPSRAPHRPLVPAAHVRDARGHGADRRRCWR